MIRFIVDSTCDLPEDVMKEHGILMVPLHVLLNGNDYRDKVDIAPDEVFAAMMKGQVPKTSQTGPEDVSSIFQFCCDSGEDFIYLTFSSALSGTYQLAKVMLSEFQQKYPHIRMQVIDSKAGSVAIGLMALQAVQLIEAGYAFDFVAEQLSFMADHVELVFTIADIGWLVKGGRISRLQGMLGSILEVKPILEVKNGLINVIKKARGSQKALAMIVDTLLERIAAVPSQIIGIAHSENMPGVDKIKNMLTEKIGATTFIICKIGSVLGSHIGIGGLGLFFFNQLPEPYFNHGA
jgi:DegV family protein with EDD domain